MTQPIAIYRIAGHGEVAVELPRLCAKVAAMFRNRWTAIDADALIAAAIGMVFTDPPYDDNDCEHDNAWVLRHPDTAMMACLYNLATTTPEVWVKTRAD